MPRVDCVVSIVCEETIFWEKGGLWCVQCGSDTDAKKGTFGLFTAIFFSLMNDVVAMAPQGMYDEK